MTQTEIETEVRAALHQIAPEIEMDDINGSADLHEEFDIDSMDFLALVTALSKRFGIDMPEADYSQMRSFNALAAYIAEKTA